MKLETIYSDSFNPIALRKAKIAYNIGLSSAIGLRTVWLKIFFFHQPIF